MCGRFFIHMASEMMAQLFSGVPANDLPQTPSYNVCPTTPVHVVSSVEGTRRLGAMRWGFLPHWYKSPTDGPVLINARAETIAEKPAFRMACRERRCIIPISGFYEWTRDGKTRLPWCVTRSDGAAMALAGIWQNWGPDQLPTCAIVTIEAQSKFADIHHRIPVVLEPDDWALWLGEQGKGAARLMLPPAEDILQFYRVDPKVNSNRASGPELIEPIDA